jgi:hypothetical protein
MHAPSVPHISLDRCRFESLRLGLANPGQVEIIIGATGREMPGVPEHLSEVLLPSHIVDQNQQLRTLKNQQFGLFLFLCVPLIARPLVSQRKERMTTAYEEEANRLVEARKLRADISDEPVFLHLQTRLKALLARHVRQEDAQKNDRDFVQAVFKRLEKSD